MANTSSRTLRLLSLLQTHRHWPGPVLADRLEVSERTLRRDVDRLRELGYPVEAHRGVEGGYQLIPGVTLPPLVLDDEEAVALAVGVQTAIQGGTVVGIEESGVRALTKIVQVMPQRLRRQVDALAAMTEPVLRGNVGAGVEASVLTTIARACRDTERLEFTYTARDGAYTTRRVEPYRLVLLGRRWYLVAWDLTRYDWRSFRLDRLTGARSTGESFPHRPLPASDAASFVRTAIDTWQTQHHVKVLLEAPAALIRQRIGPWTTVEEIDDGRCFIEMTVDSLEWAILALCATGAEFEVISPPELLGYVRDCAARFSRATNASSRRGERAKR